MSEAPPLSLYVHWPFCLAKCPYCDFNSQVVEEIDQTAWRAALLRELAHYAERLGRRPLTSIFFGGGTPSLMAPATAAAVIEAACDVFEPRDTLEVSLEANPTSAEAAAFTGFRAAGVGRLSLGVQALDDAALRALGRQHDSAQALRALELAMATFPRVSFDLIYARPAQSLAAWQAELARALALGSEHLSLYQLTVEPGTPYWSLAAQGRLVVPEEELAADLYEATQAMTGAAGRPAYEISNHAAPGAECRHNLAIWRGQDYLGIGPGAHGRPSLDGLVHAQRQHRAPTVWMARVMAAGHATQELSPLSAEERAMEVVMTALRLTEGLPRQSPIAAGLPIAALELLQESGDLALTPHRIALTPQGRLRLNAVLRVLLAS